MANLQLVRNKICNTNFKLLFMKNLFNSKISKNMLMNETDMKNIRGGGTEVGRNWDGTTCTVDIDYGDYVECGRPVSKKVCQDMM